MGSPVVTPQPTLPSQGQDNLGQILQNYPQLAGQGTAMPGMQIPPPQPIGNPNWRPRNAQSNPMVAQGEFDTKGAKTRASANSLGTNIVNAVGQIKQYHDQQQNKQLTAKYSAFTGAVKGMEAAKEMAQNAQTILQQDPNNQQAKQMLQQATQMGQQNQSVLSTMLDPSTPDGKKNAKLLAKGFGIDDKNADTPERQAAIQALQKQQPGLGSGAANIMSQMPQTLQMSPQTQVQAQMIKAKVAPSAATGTSMLQTAQKGNELAYKYTRLGLDPKSGQPIPLEQLPVQERAKIEGERAKEQLEAAQQNLAQVKAQSIGDPNSPVNKSMMARAQAGMQLASARMMMAKTGYLNYLSGSFGTDASGNALPGSQSVDGQTVGSRFAPQAAKTEKTQALFTDIDGSIEQTRKALTNLQKAGSSLTDPDVAAALADPSTTADQWLQGAVKSSLPPEKKMAVVAIKQLREQSIGMRSMVGSGVSNQQVNKIQELLPNAGSDIDYSMKQLDAMQSQLDRLHSGVLGVNKTPTAAPTLSGGQNRGGTVKPKQAAPLKAGAVQDGYKFKGGDPASPSSWEKVQ